MGSSLDEFITESSIFQLLDADGRSRLARVAHEVGFDVGETIVREGEPGDAFYAIVSGTVAVVADDFGQPKHIARIAAGSFIGEIAALTREPRTATCIAET